MKQTLSTGFLVATFIILAACDKGGGSDNKKEAVVPGPQGRVQVQNNPGVYCDFTNNSGTGSMICHNQSQSNCNSGTQTYTDIKTLCSQITQIRSNSSNCYVDEVLTLISTQQNCASFVNQQQQLNPIGSVNQNNDFNVKTVKCEFEAMRSRGFGSYIPKTSISIPVDGRMKQVVDLRTKFLFFDIGSFGNTQMTFMPAGIKGNADMITISNQGLNEKAMSLSQSGFAGQQVTLDVMSDDGEMKLSVKCGGQVGSQFKKNAVNKVYTKYTCRGTSSLYGSRREPVEMAFPFDTNLFTSELPLAQNLSATVTGDTAGSDSARITFIAYGVGQNLSMTTSSNLKSVSILKASDDLTNLDLTCGPE